jgi:UDP-N-acetylmuramoyl-L-alanyl-D-glutamate--2,6-diaminopimelate ligase
MRTTSEIAKAFDLGVPVGNQVEITSVAISSLEVLPGCLFVAVQGEKAHGIDFLSSAIAAGASAVLSDRPVQADIPVLVHEDPRSIAGNISAFVMGTMDLGLQVFGVTGTNGKTSTVFFLHQLLIQMGVKAGLSSSAFTQIDNHRADSVLTTPEAPRLHRLLSEMNDAGAKAAVVEVSAQALVRHRVDGLVFDVAGFTNLTRDHLDEFGSMENYLSAKASLFTQEFSRRSVINVEDRFGEQMLELARAKLPDHPVGLGPNQDYSFEVSGDGIKIAGKQELFLARDVGPLMSKNLALAAVMILEAGYTAEAVSAAALDIETLVPGRLELVSESTPHIYLDYAHTPQAVELAAQELSEKYSNLVIVLGASGDRDSGKRIEMGRAAGKFANHVVVTDQHPRSEDPALIRASIIAGILEVGPDSSISEIDDPAVAISKAVDLVGNGGAILWCGPGHLKYREIKGKKLPFDAYLQARKALNLD